MTADQDPKPAGDPYQNILTILKRLADGGIALADNDEVLLRRQDQTSDILSDLLATVSGLPSVRGSKTRGRRPSISMLYAETVRQEARDMGIPESTIRTLMERSLARMHHELNQTEEARKKDVSRVMAKSTESAPKKTPAAKQTKRSRKDK
jgi:hypothetical protein